MLPFALLLFAVGLTRRIDSAVHEEVPRGFSGTILVAKGGDLLIDRAYGSVKNPGARFWIASAGKQFASAAVLKCEEKGFLHLADRIDRFFPGAPVDKRAITILQLLSHTSGFGQSYVSEAVDDQRTAVARMLAEPLVDAPGRKFHYANSNYQLAAAIVETVSGRSYRAFVRDELWRPAGMTSTGFAGEAAAKLVTPIRGSLPPRLRRAYWGAEGVFSTSRDLLRWYRALQTLRVLSEASVQAMFSRIAPIEEGNAGLGWFSNKDAWFTRGNEDFGANSLIYVYPKRDAVIIVLTHAGDADEDTSWSRRILAKIEPIIE